MDIVDLVVKSLYFILPVYLSNMVMVFLYFKFLKNITTGPLGWQLDFNIKVGKDQMPLIGSHKRWEGIVTSIVVATSVVYIQRLLHPALESISVINYQAINIFGLGFLLGMGSYLGDAMKSFIKRRLHFRPHDSFLILDQIDHPLGAIALSYYWFQLDISIIVTILVMTLPLVLAVNFASYKLGVKDVWW